MRYNPIGVPPGAWGTSHYHRGHLWATFSIPVALQSAGSEDEAAGPSLAEPPARQQAEAARAAREELGAAGLPWLLGQRCQLLQAGHLRL